MVDDTDVREPRSVSQRAKEQANQAARTTERAFFNSPQVDSRIKPTRAAVVVGAGGGGGGGVTTGTAADFEDLGDQNGLQTVEITLDADREYVRQMRMVNSQPITVSIVSDGLPENNIIEMFLIFIQDGAGGRTVNPLIGIVPGTPTEDVPNPPSTASIIHDADIGPSLQMDGNRTTKYRLTTYNGGREWFVEQVALTNVAASLQELSDVELDMLAGGQILKYNEFDQVWKNEAGVDVLNDLSNVIALGPTDKHILAFDGASQQWVNRTLMDVADPNLYSDAEDAVNAARDAAIDFFTAAESAVTTARDAALVLIDAAEDAINAARDAAIDIINAAEDLVITTRDAVIDVLNAAEDLVETTRDAIISVIESARDAAIDVIEAAERLVETTRDAAIAVIEAAEQLVETARDAAIAVIESLRDAANEVIDNARDAAVVVINTTRDAANDVIDNAEEAAVLTINTARDAAVVTIEAAESLVETTRDSAIATINATASAIESIFDAAGDFTQDFLDAIGGNMPTVDISGLATRELGNLRNTLITTSLNFANGTVGGISRPNIGADNNRLFFKTPSNGRFNFQSANLDQFEIFNRGLRLADGVVGPTVNGEIKRHGNTISVRVNGVTRDLADIGQGGGQEIDLTELESSLVPERSNRYDLGTNSDRWSTIYASGILATTASIGTGSLDISGNLQHTGPRVGFFGVSPDTRPFVSTVGGTASAANVLISLNSLISALRELGLIR